MIDKSRSQENEKVNKTEKVIKIGTRGSALAMTQAKLVSEALKVKFPDYDFRLVSMSTKGDREQNRALLEFGGKAVFVEEFEEAILDGRIDMAVHSAKDMPTEIMAGLTIAGVLPRACPQDVLICRQGERIDKSSELVIGTSSLRRQYQIKELYPKAVCKKLRGNVTTRLDKLRAKEFDCIILAAAGIERLGLNTCPDLTYEYLPVELMTPAACQGIIAIESKKEGIAYDMANEINDANTYRQLVCERKVLNTIGAGCHEPVGVYSTLDGDDLTLTIYRGPEMSKEKRSTASGKWQELDEIINKIIH